MAEQASGDLEVDFLQARVKELMAETGDSKVRPSERDVITLYDDALRLLEMGQVVDQTAINNVLVRSGVYISPLGADPHDSQAGNKTGG